MRKHPVLPLHKQIVPVRKILLELKLKQARKIKTPEFTRADLENVLKGLKSNKARDPEGIDRTLFKSSIIGTDFKMSLLQLLNNIKKKQVKFHIL